MKKKKSKKKTSFISKTAMTVLTIILIILFFCIMSMVEKIQGTARVVNYAGLVRGKTQRIIKLEDAGEPQDTMIADINAYIDGLRNGRETNISVPLPFSFEKQSRRSISSEETAEMSFLPFCAD